MELLVEDLPNGGVKAVLRGRMDIEGAQQVDTRFSALAGSKKAIVVDMGGVDFVASMGLRTLMQCAKAITAKGGKMAIANAQPNVVKVLSTSGVDQVIPVSASLEAAIAAVG